MALAFFSRALATGEQLAEPAIGGAVARIDQNVRRMAGEYQPRTDQQPWFVFELRIAKLIVSPHHACKGVVIGNTDRGQAKLAGLMHVGLRMRSALQEREIRGDADLGIGRVHANSPCTNQSGGTALSSRTISPYSPLRKSQNRTPA